MIFSRASYPSNIKNTLIAFTTIMTVHFSAFASDNIKTETNLNEDKLLTMESNIGVSGNEVPAFFSGFVLNVDSNALDKLMINYGVANVDIGYLLLDKDQACNFSHVTDGSGVNPVTGHEAEYQRFVANGGSLGLIISGDIGSTTQDPLLACNENELTSFIINAIEAAPVTIDRITFDIEGSAFYTGQFGSEIYNKLAGVITSLHQHFPSLDIDLTIPGATQVWSGGYNTALINFFKHLKQQIDIGKGIRKFYIMTEMHSDVQIKNNWVIPTQQQLLTPTEFPASHTGILFVNGSRFVDASAMRSYFPEYSDMTVLVTKHETVQAETAALYQTFNNTVPRDDIELEPEQGEMSLTLSNQSADIGVNIYIRDDSTNTLLFSSDYLSPLASKTYTASSYSSTSSLLGQSVNVYIAFYGRDADNAVQCHSLNNLAIEGDKEIYIDITDPNAGTVSCW
ncbi:hypothetical protein [uncultured Shewanella sp.]|uniref:hypothetical protein n=1 Tax=uncultured Shewanella sp. TaxID=173975 RepID=UPI00262A6929|nr:hypothetical protein [uncultured Shewanella sp.]